MSPRTEHSSVSKTHSRLAHSYPFVPPSKLFHQEKLLQQLIYLLSGNQTRPDLQTTPLIHDKVLVNKHLALETRVYDYEWFNRPCEF